MNNPKTNLLLKASSEAIFISEQQAIISCNDVALELFGYSMSQVLSLSAESLFVPEEKELIRQNVNDGRYRVFEAEALTFEGRKFDAQVQVKTIWDGDLSYVSFTLRDISDFKHSQQNLLARDALLEAVSYTAAKFLESKNWRLEIDDVLKHIGEASEVSRVYVFQNFTDGDGELFMTQKYEWTARDIELQIDNSELQKLYYKENGLERLTNVMPRGEAIMGLVKNLPNSERLILEAQGIQSVFLTPIFLAGEWWGFIGYDECNFERVWSQNDVKMLNTVADIFNSALEQEKMKMELEWSNDNFMSLFNNSPDSIFVYDYDGFVLDANAAACQLNGIPKEQIINRHVTELVPEADAKKVADDFKLWTTGEHTFMESHSFNSEGRNIPVEIRGSRNLFFNIPAVVLMVRDISLRKDAEELLNKRLEFIQFISQISSDFIKIDLKNIEGAVNKALEFVCKFTGTDRGYVFLTSSSQTRMILANEYCDPGYKPLKGNFDAFDIAEFEQIIPTLKGGENIIFHSDRDTDEGLDPAILQVYKRLQVRSLINIPLIVGDFFLGYIGFDSMTDIADWDQETIDAFMLTGQIIANIVIRRKTEGEIIQAKNKAEQSDRLKSAFLGQISHEMRTPLNSIIGFADMLLLELKENEMLEMVDFILSSGNRLLNTFNLIIDLSEIEANVMKAQLDILSINQSINSMLPVFLNRANEKKLELSFVEKHSELKIMADESLFEKIIYNLVDNALKYTNEGSIQIEVGFEDVGGRHMAMIGLKDSGIGIQSDKLDDIFSNFRQASEGYNREFEGSGLGLSVTRGMVQLMDGEISVRSEFGKGSEFIVMFPLVSTFSGSSQPVFDSLESIQNKQSIPRILVVEDELIHQKYLEYILKGDYEVTFVENGVKGMELALENQFDLIILDINLGKDLNGIETLQQIRKIEGYEGIKAIAATANVMKGHKELFLSKGFNHYIPKPYTAEDMKQLVDGILKI